MPTIIIDLIIILIIALFTFIGYKQGLIKVAIKIFSFIIAIIVAITLYKPAANLIIAKTSLDETIKNTMVKKITPEGLKSTDQVKVPDNISQSIIGGANQTIDEISNTISIKIIEVSSLLIIFIIVKILLKFVSAIADLIAKLPIIKQFNKLGGTLYGLIEGILIIYILLAILSMVAPLIESNIITEIDQSLIGGMMYNNNILLNIIF